MKNNFFKSYLFYGIICVLSGVIVQLVLLKIINNDIYQLIMNIIATSATTIGIGLIIGYVMDMTKNSNEYINYIQERLKETVVSRKFISDLSVEEKLKIVERCLTTDTTHEMLSKYVQYKALKISKLCEGHLRSNIDYLTVVKKRGGQIELHTTMKYKIYKVNNSYQTITHLFRKSTGTIQSLKIINPAKKVYNVSKDLLQTKPIIQNQNEDEIIYSNTVKIPSHLQHEKYLTIQSEAKEYGNDHWAHLEWMSLYPTDGISYRIICEDDLIIKEHMIFDDQRGLFSTTTEKNEKGEIVKFTINCDEWTDPYTGFSLIVAVP